MTNPLALAFNSNDADLPPGSFKPRLASRAMKSPIIAFHKRGRKTVSNERKLSGVVAD
jgi:hypothetical protein